MKDQSTSAHSSALGPLLMIASIFGYTGLDAVLKILVQTSDPIFLCWARTLLQVALLLALAPWLGIRTMPTLNRPGLQLARATSLVVTSVVLVLAWRDMPLAQVYAIGLSAPLVAAALATVVLREYPHWQQWALIIGAFVGVLIALRPDAPDAGWHLIYPVAFALSTGINHVMTRVGSRSDSTASQLFYATLFAFLMLSLALPWFWSTLPAKDWVLLVLGAIFGVGAQLLMIVAFTRAPTAVVSPMIYFQIVSAAIVGYLLFGEVPSTSTLVGAGIVSACGIALLRWRA